MYDNKYIYKFIEYRNSDWEVRINIKKTLVTNKRLWKKQ